ncbi:Rpp14/Pop5 family-domain-containing protein [Lactarius psammicola]|nr:Rpp14/Pop5 family-domain-containing protein [Lactarius psammicola]
MVRFKVPVLLYHRPAHAAIEPANQNRWLLVEFIPAITTTTSSVPAPTSSQAISGKDIFNALKQSVLSNFGDTGWGEVGASLSVKYFSPATHLCIIRVARGEAARTTWAALVLLDKIGNNDGHKVVPHVIHVSGTLKHAQIAAIEWNREAIARVKAGAGVQGACHAFLFSGYRPPPSHPG